MANKISLVIPVKDEAGSLEALLESIDKQTRFPDEIVFADAGSRDETVDIIESYKTKGHPVILVKAGNAYPGKARNMAIEHSQHPLIAMTDAGIILDKNWLQKLLQLFEDGKDVDIIYGHYEPIVDSFFKECLALTFLSVPKTIHGKKMRPHSVASCMMRKSVWERVGGFPDFRAAEDRIFMEKVERNGFKVGYATDAKAFWNIPSDFRSTFNRFSLYSMHDLRAGRFKDWHYPVLRMYALGFIFILLGIVFSPIWFIFIGIGILARAISLIFEKAQGDSLFKKLDIKRISLVAIIMLWIDFAMFWGVVRNILESRNREFKEDST